MCSVCMCRGVCFKGEGHACVRGRVCDSESEPVWLRVFVCEREREKEREKEREGEREGVCVAGGRDE